MRDLTKESIIPFVGAIHGNQSVIIIPALAVANEAGFRLIRDCDSFRILVFRLISFNQFRFIIPLISSIVFLMRQSV
jgi:hypothetical protein